MPAKPIRNRLICRTCCKDKSIGDYYECPSSKYGVRRSCKDCFKAQVRSYRQRPESIEKRVYWEKNVRDLDKKRLYMKEWYSSESGEEWREKYKEQHKENKKRYNSSEKGRAYNREYQARRRSAIPPWADLKSIKEFYKNCPEGYHVDHIIPLNGRNVSGLHVLANLQYLPAEENLKKSNKYAK